MLGVYLVLRQSTVMQLSREAWLFSSWRARDGRKVVTAVPVAPVCARCCTDASGLQRLQALVIAKRSFC